GASAARVRRTGDRSAGRADAHRVTGAGALREASCRRPTHWIRKRPRGHAKCCCLDRSGVGWRNCEEGRSVSTPERFQRGHPLPSFEGEASAEAERELSGEDHAVSIALAEAANAAAGYGQGICLTTTS